MTKPPRYIALVIAVAVTSLLLTLLVAWRVDLLGDREEQRDCARAVAVRDDNRAMWLYLLDEAQPADDKRARDFRAELNDRLPALKCADGDPVPVAADRP